MKIWLIEKSLILLLIMEKIQIVTPVYNEEKNIYSTLENFFEEYKDNNFKISFIHYIEDYESTSSNLTQKNLVLFTFL